MRCFLCCFSCCMEIIILVKSFYLCSFDCLDRLLKEGEKKVLDVIIMYLGSYFIK